MSEDGSLGDANGYVVSAGWFLTDTYDASGVQLRTQIDW